MHVTRVATLIIEDDAGASIEQRRLVEKHPRFFIVGEARTHFEGLYLASVLKPGLVILDATRRYAVGRDVLQHLRALPGDPVEVMVVTTDRSVVGVRRAMACGVSHYLVKPFAPRVLWRHLDLIWFRRERILALGETVEQADIDRLWPPALTGGSVAVPKGLSPHTLELVERTLRSAVGHAGTSARSAAPVPPGEPAQESHLSLRPTPHGVSATRVGALAGLSRVTARRYLRYLVELGRAHVVSRYGCSGRPEHLFVPLDLS